MDMEKRKFEKLGVETSLLGFGCMRLPMTADEKIDEPEAERMLDRAIASGVNYIDTAYPYHGGDSEPFVGRVLKKYDRDSFYLATKLPVWQVKTLEDADRIFEDQLARLQTDHIDFYLLHALNSERFENLCRIGLAEHAAEWKKQGRIRYLGFSFHDSYETFERILNYRDWDFCQIQLNYMDAEQQAGMRGYRLAEEKGVPMIIMEPVKGGSLAAYADDITGRFRSLDPNASVASFALRWVGSLPNVKVVLSGMSTMEQMEDNLKTFSSFKPLSERESREIRDIVDLINSRIQNGCTGCKYCMPCPAGVDIPGNFRVWNTYHMYQNYNMVKKRWEVDLADGKQAKNCIKCGRCAAVCPQKISVPEDLEKVQADMDKKEYIF